MTDPALTLATILSLALAVVFFVRMRDAHRRCAALEADRGFNARWMAQKDITISELLQENAEKDRLWKDARQRYLDSLDEIAELRDGGGTAA